MKALVNRRALHGLIGLVLAAVAGCVAGPGYEGGVGVGYGVGFYEPYGYDYGGWGPGYRVGPPRRDFDRRGRPDFHAAPHPSYRPAAPARPMPSLPTHPRGR